MSLDLVTLVIEAQRRAAKSLADRNAALASVAERLAQAQEETGLELHPPASDTGKPAPASPSTLFAAAFAARAAEYQAHVAVGAAIVRLTQELEARKATATERQDEIDKAAQELAQAVEAAKAYKRRVGESAGKDREKLDDQGDTFYQGCALGLGMGCLSLGGYILLTVIMVFAGRATATTSPLGVLFLTMFVVPIGVAALMQLAFGLKRSMVEAELKARVRAAEDACERRIEQARAAHGKREPELKTALDEATDATKKIEAALERLKAAA